MASEGCGVTKRRKSQSELIPAVEQRENIIYLLVKIKCFVYKHSQIPDAVCACDRRLTQFVIRTLPFCFSTQGNDSGFVAGSFRIV